MRPKELWEKDIARWKKRRAKAAEKNAATGAARAETAATPAPKEAVKGEPASVGNKPPASNTTENMQQPRTNAPAAPTSLKRNLSAIAEQETQQRADQRKQQHTKSRTEQLANHDSGPTTAVHGKENVASHGRGTPVAVCSGGQAADSGATSNAIALQPSTANSAAYEIPAAVLQQLNQIPEAVLKRYLGQSPLDLVPAGTAISVDRRSQANSQRSPATSPTEVGSITDSQNEIIEWGDADLAGLFRLSQSQQAESVVSFATTVNHPLEPMPTSGVDVGGHLGSDEFAMDGIEGQQNETTYQDGTEFALETDPYALDLPSRANNEVNSSPVRRPFDFSQLPPSSPPMYDQDEVDHAAALWSSSPETSPVDFGTISVKEVSPLRPTGGAMDDLLQSLERSAQAEALRLINESNL